MYLFIFVNCDRFHLRIDFGNVQVITNLMDIIHTNGNVAFGYKIQKNINMR